MDEVVNKDDIITRKILKEIDDINEFINNVNEAEFYNDIKTQKAVIMSLINIGELSKSYTDNFISVKNKIPWKKVQSVRNIAAHKYETIDMQIVWDTLQINIPDLKKELVNDGMSP